MTIEEKKHTEKVADKLADAVHKMNKLNKEQIDYLDLLFIQQDIDKLLKNIK